MTGNRVFNQVNVQVSGYNISNVIIHLLLEVTGTYLLTGGMRLRYMVPLMEGHCIGMVPLVTRHCIGMVPLKGVYCRVYKNVLG